MKSRVPPFALRVNETRAKKILSIAMISIIFLSGLFFLSFNAYATSSQSSVHYITKLPYRISKPGVYVLKVNGTGNGMDNAITIKANNVVLKGEGHTLKGWQGGVYVTYAHNVTVENLTLENNTCGVYLEHASGVTVSKVTSKENKYWGMFLDHSSWNTITNNAFINDGVFIVDSYNNTFKEDTVNGLPLLYLEGVSHKVVKGNVGQVMLVNCSDIAVENLKISKVVIAVELEHTENSKITGSFFWKDCIGVTILNSSHDIVEYNVFHNDTLGGIVEVRSSNTLLSENVITNCSKESAIWYWKCSKNNVTKNVLQNDKRGVALIASTSNLVAENVIKNVTYGIYLEASKNNTIEDNLVEKCGYGIFLYFPRLGYNNITDNIVENCTYGILLQASSYNIMEGNLLQGNHWGFHLWESSYNVIRKNVLENNTCGIYLSKSKDNLIWDNNFIHNKVEVKADNAPNFWNENNTGNYWSDYNGTDLNHDGIGDTPYVINKENLDRYPLMKPVVISTPTPPTITLKPRSSNVPVLSSWEIAGIVIAVCAAVGVGIWAAFRRKRSLPFQFSRSLSF